MIRDCPPGKGRTMTQINPASLLIAAHLALLAPAPSRAAVADDRAAPPAASGFGDWITSGKAGLEFRYRIEGVDQEQFADDALASTLRSRLNYRTATWQGWLAYLEADNVFVVGDDDSYSSTRNGVDGRPVVADPEYTEANQFYLQFRNDAFGALAGRQRIALDNQRFIGNVGWRQNEQTFDALTVQSAGDPTVGWHYSYLENVNRVFGPEDGSPPGDLRSNSHALNLRHETGRFGTIVAFGYLLDFENAAELSSQTCGLLWTGNRRLGGGTKLGWGASWAHQSDYGNNATHFDADYFYAEGVLTAGRTSLTLGFESLGGDETVPGRAFQTPLATLHAFQGWADKFLTTPGQGVMDVYAGLGHSLGPLALRLVWHDYAAEATGDDYGSEWNASAAWKFAERYEAMLKLADYRADGFATDTTKVWVQFSAVF
jgi:Alginate export